MLKKRNKALQGKTCSTSSAHMLKLTNPIVSSLTAGGKDPGCNNGLWSSWLRTGIDVRGSGRSVVTSKWLEFKGPVQETTKDWRPDQTVTD